MNASKLRRLNSLASAFVASLVISQAALAADPGWTHGFVTKPVTRTVDARGLDLTSPAGAARLYRQIVATARHICRHSLTQSPGVRRAKVLHGFVEPCIAEAVSNALAQYTAATGRNLEQVAGIDSAEAADLRALR